MLPICHRPGCATVHPSSSRHRSTICHAAAPQPPQEKQVEFTYRSEDGRAKATMEDVFHTDNPLPDHEVNPWQFSWQMNERVLVWSDELKARLVKRVVGDQLQLSDEQVDQRLNQLAVLLPPLQHKLSVIKPALLARLCADPASVAAALLRLKTIFPEANVATMALRCPALVVGDVALQDVERSAAALREMLPSTRVDVLVEAHPDTMLDVEGLGDAMQRAREVLPDVDVERMLANDPSSVFSFQRGRRLIPYDADTHE